MTSRPRSRRERFREDLYYRLKVVEIDLPPLRDRLEDLPGLAARFLEQIAERLGRPARHLGADAMAALRGHPWPGNVRELRNAIEQAAVLADGDEIGASDLPVGKGAAPPPAPCTDLSFSDAKRQAIEGFERAYLVQALRDHAGNITRTAESIGIARQSLQQKIKELGLEKPDWGG